MSPPVPLSAYRARRVQRCCVQCVQPVTDGKARCRACRARNAAAQARYRIKQIVEGR